MNPAVKLNPTVDWKMEAGPLRPLLVDDSVSEIMVNSHNEIFVERGGMIERSTAQFSNAMALNQCIQSLCVHAGREVNRKMPFLDARLPDGSRMNVVVPPVAFGGPVLTIRKAQNALLNYRALINAGSLTEKAVYFLNKCVDCRQNIVITGGGGSGKTTLLSVLTSFIDGNQRVITIEDATEVAVQVKNFVRMELPQSVSSEARVTMTDLLRNALRMRPDRIVVGECRGPETLDMLLAMNTGHEGSMTTIHANQAIDGLARMESMVVHSGTSMPMSLIQKNIGTTVQFVMHVERGPDGKRRLEEVLEIRGWEGGQYLTTPIFKWNEDDGLVTLGNVPRFALKSPVPGIEFPDARTFFKPDTDVSFSSAPKPAPK